MVSFSYGLQNVVTNEVSKSQSTRVVNITSEKTKKIKLDTTNIAKFKSMSGVSSVEQIVNVSGKLVYHGFAISSPIYAVTEGYFEATPLNFVAGDKFSSQNIKLKPLIVNKVVLDAFGIKDPQSALNQEISVDFVIPKELDSDIETNTKVFEKNTYKIIGIIDEETTPIVYAPADDVFGFGVQYSSQAKAIVDYPNQMSSIRQQIEDLGFHTTNINDTISQVDQIFKIIKILLWLMGFITLLVSVIGTLNTITISLVEQTREIGFLRLLGIKENDVRSLFMVQSLILAVGGAIIGAILGSLGCLLLNWIVISIAHRSAIKFSTFASIPYSAILILLVASIIIGFLVGLGPSRRAVNIDPLKALAS
jgi:putative ABC transport system permease protein